MTFLHKRILVWSTIVAIGAPPIAMICMVYAFVFGMRDFDTGIRTINSTIGDIFHYAAISLLLLAGLALMAMITIIAIGFARFVRTLTVKPQ